MVKERDEWNPVTVTALSYSSRRYLLVAGLSTGIFCHRYLFGIRLEPIVRWGIGIQAGGGETGTTTASVRWDYA